MEFPIIGIGVGALSVPFLYFLWVAARRVVRWGFFLFYALIGALLALAGLWYVEVSRTQLIPYAVIAGISFASICSAVRTRIARLVGALFVFSMVAIIGWRLYLQTN